MEAMELSSRVRAIREDPNACANAGDITVRGDSPDAFSPPERGGEVTNRPVVQVDESRRIARLPDVQMKITERYARAASRDPLEYRASTFVKRSGLVDNPPINLETCGSIHAEKLTCKF